MNCLQHEDKNKSQTIRIRNWGELGRPGPGPGPSEEDLTVVRNTAAQIFLEGLLNLCDWDKHFLALSGTLRAYFPKFGG